LQKVVSETKSSWKRAKPEEGERTRRQGGTWPFQFGERKSRFVAETFLLVVSLPNFHSNATTAYGHSCAPAACRCGKKKAGLYGTLRIKR